MSQFGNKITDGLSSVTQANASLAVKTPDGAQGANKLFENFGAILKQNLQQVSALDDAAGHLQEQYATGAPIPLHQVMLAGARAETALDLTMQIRNKMVSAYQEVERMAI